jgi:hypothetical protein
MTKEEQDAAGVESVAAIHKAVEALRQLSYDTREVAQYVSVSIELWDGDTFNGSITRSSEEDA